MARKRRVTIAWLMAAVAVFAVALATLRFEFEILIYTAPLAGFLWDARRGGRGFIRGFVGGVITLFWFIGLGLLAITWCQSDPRSLKSVSTVTNFLILTGVGATFGTVVGASVWLLTTVLKVIWSLLNIPKSLRLRAKRSEGANSFRRGGPVGTPNSP